MNRPNFFILGAPKCGTTSMATWLSDHPQIFMSTPKEPHYYNKDHNNAVVTNYQQYISLFKNATHEHKIIGEASVWYLHSKEAVLNIKKDLSDKDIRFLVMLRNPVQMVHSLHQQLVWNMVEPEKNFKIAWNLQWENRRNKMELDYGNICKLGEQLNRLYNTVDRDSVKVILFDDLKNNPADAYASVLNFLDLPFDKRKDFIPLNEGKERRYNNIANFIKNIGLMKQKLKIRKGLGILTKMQAKNTISKKRENLDIDFENELKAYFKDDICLLSSLINKDLSHWF